jgi:hypothetical protein
MNPIKVETAKKLLAYSIFEKVDSYTSDLTLLAITNRAKLYQQKQKPK